MIRLYIDFDGVVMDSIPPLYDALENKLLIAREGSCKQ